MIPKLIWDANKAKSNATKHGVTFNEAASVFRDPHASIIDDDRHSDEEYREIIIGHSNRQRLIVVSYTERGDVIRIISARKATKGETNKYGDNK